MTDVEKEFQSIINQLLVDDKLILPMKTSEDYHDELRKKIDLYIERLDNLSTDGELAEWVRSNLEGIKETSCLILSSLKEYLAGSAGAAYQKIDEYFEKQLIKDYLPELIVTLNSYNCSTKQPNSLYRVRCSNTVLSSREEMFHIPMDKRHMVGIQRYSIAGLPSLYLGSSIYICWEEMGRPNFDSMYISAFKTTKVVKVIDFSFSLSTLRNNRFIIREISENKFKAYLTYFPLVMSCGFNRKHINSRFNVEYVIPNLVLQWVSKNNEDVHGIKYTSTKIKGTRASEYIHSYVFPPKNNGEYQNRGYCKQLQNGFKLTSPSSWGVLDAVSSPNNSEYDRGKVIEIDEELRIKYKDTKFWKIENCIELHGNFEKIEKNCGSV